MKVLVADDDEISRRLLSQTIRRAKHEVVTVADGTEALRVCQSSTPPEIAVLDWEMPGLTGPEVCRRVRERPGTVKPYLLLVTVRNGRRDVLEGLEAGADDMLSKPVPPDLLLARMNLAARCASRAPTRIRGEALLLALREAQREGDGELVIRDGEVSARVYFCKGRLGWIHIAQEPGSLSEVLAPEASIDSETAQSVARECRETGTPLSQILLARGLLERAQLRSCLNRWIRLKLQRLLTLETPNSLFVPQPRPSTEDLLFELEDVLPDGVAVQPSEPPRATGPSGPLSEPFLYGETPCLAVDESLDRCMTATGIKSAVAVDQVTGMCLASRGQPLDADIVWASVRHVRAASRESPESSVLTTKGYFHFACTLPSSPTVIVCVCFDLLATSMGAAWSELRASLS